MTLVKEAKLRRYPRNDTLHAVQRLRGDRRHLQEEF
jgi:hypothetical protein